MPERKGTLCKQNVEEWKQEHTHAHVHTHTHSLSLSVRARGLTFKLFAVWAVSLAFDKRGKPLNAELDALEALFLQELPGNVAVLVGVEKAAESGVVHNCSRT